MPLIRFQARSIAYPSRKGKGITVDNRFYKSIKDACTHYNLKYNVIRDRLFRYKWTIEEAFELVKKSEYVVEGTDFKYFKRACDHYGIGYQTVKYRLAQGWSKEEAFNIVKRKNRTYCEGKIYVIKNKINKKKYVGLTTISIKERFWQHKRDAKRGKNTKLCKALRKYGVDNFYIKLLDTTTDRSLLPILEIKYIKKYNSLEKGYNSGVGSGCSGDKYGKSIYYKGIKFISIVSLANYLGLSRLTVMHRLKNNIPLDNKLNKRQGILLSYEGKTFDSRKDLADYLGMSTNTLKNRIKKGIPLNQAKPKHYIK